MSDLYILEGKIPVRVKDIVEWGKAYNSQDRIVGNTLIQDVRVSTVFLGMDHRFISQGPPILFETMIFGGEHDGYCERCSTWEQAEAEHHKACALVVS